jgi:hypothetical protein
VTGTSRFVCSDPDAGDFEFTDVDAVLDALEAALVQPATPLFDAVRQSWQPAGLHPEIRAAWEARLRYRPPSASGLALPALPSVTALVRSLPQPASPRRAEPAPLPAASGADAGPGRPFAALGLLWAALVLAAVAWAVVVLASRVADLAAGAARAAGRQ